jgi:hypothetical protein
MSGLFIVGVFGGIVTCGCIHAALRHWTKPKDGRYPAHVGCLPLFLFPFTFYGCAYLSFVIVNRQGNHATPEQASGALMFFELPSSASDVNYRNNFFNGLTDHADFRISEADFLRWMKENSWHPKEFRSNDAPNEWDRKYEWTSGEDSSALDHLMFSIDTIDPEAKSGRSKHVIWNGYYFKEGVGDRNRRIWYDKDNGRAFVEHSTF